MGQDTIKQEDVDFRSYLEMKGFDVSLFGLQTVDTPEKVEKVEDEKCRKAGLRTSVMMD